MHWRLLANCALEFGYPCVGALNLHVAGLQCIGGFGELRLEFGYPRVGALNLHVAGLQCIGGFGDSCSLEFGYCRALALSTSTWRGPQ